MVELYKESGLDVYEAAHYSHGEAAAEVAEILSWFAIENARVLDLGCSGGLHALEFARCGFRVTGVDLEPSAIGRARERSNEARISADFFALDISQSPLAPLGGIDLVYSIGNVLSHLPKTRIGEVFSQTASLLPEGGFLVFDLLMNDERLPEGYLEEASNIFWKRELDVKTGKLTLEGDFLDFGVSQKFEVWAYGVEEAAALLEAAGFSAITAARTLAFDQPYNPALPAACARFRARRGK